MVVNLGLMLPRILRSFKRVVAGQCDPARYRTFPTLWLGWKGWERFARKESLSSLAQNIRAKWGPLSALGVPVWSRKYNHRGGFSGQASHLDSWDGESHMSFDLSLKGRGSFMKIPLTKKSTCRLNTEIILSLFTKWRVASFLHLNPRPRFNFIELMNLYKTDKFNDIIGSIYHWWQVK